LAVQSDYFASRSTGGDVECNVTMNMLQVLSRAFRNRFIELHFDEIPSCELVEILQKRCQLPQSYSQLLVNVMLRLQVSTLQPLVGAANG